MMPVQKKIMYGLCLIACALALYCYNPLLLYFQSDDFVHISLSAAASFLQQHSFRPSGDLSIMADYAIWGNHAWGYHSSNLLLHVIACILFFYLLRLLLLRYTTIKEPAFIARLSTVLFFIYAMHSEAVFWILGRSAILASISSFLFLYCYLKRNVHTAFVPACIFAWICCLLSYESTWVLPAFTIIISMADIRSGKSTRQKELIYHLLIIFIFVIYLFARVHFIHEITGMYEAALFLNGDYMLLAKHYTLLFIRTVVPAFINNKIALGLFLLITLFITVRFIKAKLYKHTAATLLLCLLIALLPYTSLGIDTNGTESERFLYFPSAVVIAFFAVVTGAGGLKNYCLYTALYSLHLFILFSVTDNYRAAGNINKQVVLALSQTGSKKVLYIDGLPQSQNGAFILRQGFPQMLQLMCNKNPDTIITCSVRHELLPLQLPYTIRYADNLQILCGNRFILASADTMLLKFTDSTLFIGK